MLFTVGRFLGLKFLYYEYHFGVNFYQQQPQLTSSPALQPACETSVFAQPILPPCQSILHDMLP